jgi:prolyl-tRNA editing enzyme YbaK/EbsC (Cys-tRNA(Pro) deacylase)
MSEPLSPAAERVQELLRAAGSEARVRQLPVTARTAADAAAAIGCTVAQIAKSLVFKTRTGKPILVIASGINRVDEAKIAAALGESIGKADAGFVRETTGYAIGGVAPIGHSVPPRIFVDQDLRAHATLWASAGHPHAVFPVSPAELERLTRGTVTEVK